MEIYCLSCKKITRSKNIKGKTTKNNKPYLIGNCDLCNKLNLNLFLLNKLREMDFFLIYLKIFLS